MKAVLFDFGNVLYTVGYDRFFGALADHSTMSAPELRNFLFDGNASLSTQFETGKLSAPEFLLRLREAAGIPLTTAEIETLFVDIFEPNEPVLELVRDLATKTPVGLISNTNELHFQGYMRHIPIFPLFSAVALSYVVGEMKPGAKMYQYAREQLGLQARECIFVDDLEENVAAAESFGFTAIHYRLGMDLRAAVFPIIDGHGGRLN